MPRDRSDNSKVESLVKILRREQATGFEDSAVIGGLDRFLQQAEEELVPLLGPIKSYAALPQEQRERWTAAALRRLEKAAANLRKRARQQPAAVNRRLGAVRGSSRCRWTTKSPASRESAAATCRSSRSSAWRGYATSSTCFLIATVTTPTSSRWRSFSPARTGRSWRPSGSRLRGTPGRGGERRRRCLATRPGNVRAFWFNNPYVARNLRPGALVSLSGLVGVFRGQLSFQSPEYELLGGSSEETMHTGRLVPVYPSTEDLPQTDATGAGEARPRRLPWTGRRVPARRHPAPDRTAWTTQRCRADALPGLRGRPDRRAAAAWRSTSCSFSNTPSFEKTARLA